MSERTYPFVQRRSQAALEIDPHYAKLWLDFTYAGHRFTIHNLLGYWLSVADPACPEPILSAVASHFLLINPE